MVSFNDLCQPYRLPLSREQFALALRHGLGRAHLHIERYGIGDCGDLLLAACLETQAYDRQIESDRIRWTFPLLDVALKSELLRKLPEAARQSEDFFELEQMAELCLLLHKDGYPEARGILLQMFRLFANDFIGAAQIVEMDGAEGLVWVAQRMLESSPPDETSDYLDALLGSYRSPFELGQARQILAQYPEIAAQLSAESLLEKTCRRPVDAVPSLLEVLELLRFSSGGYVRGAAKFVDTASKPELVTIAEALNGETCPKVIVRFLKLFRRVDYPLSPEPLLKLAQHQDDKVRWDAFGALARVEHPKVRELALDSLRSQQWDEGQMALFGPNYQSGDGQLLNQYLRFDDDEPFLHHVLASNLADLIEEHSGADLLEVMFFVYQSAYCSLCRRKAYEAMQQIGLVPDWIEAEFPFDCSQLESDV